MERISLYCLEGFSRGESFCQDNERRLYLSQGRYLRRSFATLLTWIFISGKRIPTWKRCWHLRYVHFQAYHGHIRAFCIDIEYASYDSITHPYQPRITAFSKMPTIADWFPAIATFSGISWHWNKASDWKDFNPSASSRHLHKVSQHRPTILSSLLCRNTLLASSHWIDNLLLLSSKHTSSYEWFALSAFCVTPRNDCATLRYYKKSLATAQVDAAVRECLSDSPAHNTEFMTVLINVKEYKFGLFRLRQRHPFRLNRSIVAESVDTALTQV